MSDGVHACMQISVRGAGGVSTKETKLLSVCLCARVLTRIQQRLEDHHLYSKQAKLQPRIDNFIDNLFSFDSLFISPSISRKTIRSALSALIALLTLFALLTAFAFLFFALGVRKELF